MKTNDTLNGSEFVLGCNLISDTGGTGSGGTTGGGSGTGDTGSGGGTGTGGSTTGTTGGGTGTGDTGSGGTTGGGTTGGGTGSGGGSGTGGSTGGTTGGGTTTAGANSFCDSVLSAWPTWRPVYIFASPVGVPRERFASRSPFYASEPTVGRGARELVEFDGLGIS